MGEREKLLEDSLRRMLALVRTLRNPPVLPPAMAKKLAESADRVEEEARLLVEGVTKTVDAPTKGVVKRG